MSDNPITFLQVLSYTAEKTAEMAKSSSVVGEKIEIDGKTIIPISKISAGFAGGGADIADEMKKKKTNPSGVGAKVTVTPTAFLIIDGNSVKTVSVDGESGAAGTLASIIAQIKAISDKARKKKKEEKKAEKAALKK